MTRKEIAHILNQFEKDHPVDEWTVDKIHIWPMIKIDLFFRWLKKTDERYNNSAVSEGKRNNLLKKLYLTLVSVYELITLWFKPKSKKAHILFIDSKPYRSIVDGEKR